MSAAKTVRIRHQILSAIALKISDSRNRFFNRGVPT
jgi:hypothetical protein